MPDCPSRRARVCSLLAGLLLGTAVQAETPLSVPTRPDPFAMLDALDAGRIASNWSSLPAGDGCADDQVRLSGHAMLLLESSEDRRDIEPGLFSFVEPRHRLQLDTTGQWGCVFGQLAVQRQIDAQGDFWSWDGSALSWRIDPHWRIGAGRIARHWGPGWDGSLILGTAARPIVSVALDATSGALPRDSFWWWLGELELSAFFGQVDGDRGDYDRPNLMGLRLVVRPWPWLELGASRVSMWGGEGRDNSLDMFLRSLIGRDNQNGDPSLQPGNGLGGFDARWDVSPWLPGIALYGQMIGEDEAANLPSKYMFLAGADWRHRDGMVFAEWTDSTAKLAGVAYNHHIFSDGYRYRGRPLGHWGDGDSNLWSVGGLLRDVAGGQALAVLRYGRLNQNGVNPSWPDARFGSASLQWRTVLDRAFGLTLALDHVQLSPRGAAGGETQRDTQLRIQFDAWLH
jgi:hypothetical protein